MVPKGKRPRDPNQLAAWTVAISTGQIPTPEPEVPPEGTATVRPPTNVSEYMSAIGRKGGQIGGKRRLKTMTKAERTKVARKAAKTRWKNARHSAR
jgi:hypothetical protein